MQETLPRKYAPSPHKQDQPSFASTEQFLMTRDEPPRAVSQQHLDLNLETETQKTQKTMMTSVKSSASAVRRGGRNYIYETPASVSSAKQTVKRKSGGHAGAQQDRKQMATSVGRSKPKSQHKAVDKVPLAEGNKKLPDADTSMDQT